MVRARIKGIREARSMRSPGVLSAKDFDAVIFDLDGVITQTAKVHAAAWKELFDAYLIKRQAKGGGGELSPFDLERDYRRSVDGKPRYQGVQSFLESRQIRLPWGEPSDPAGAETICGLGNRKNAIFNARLAQDGAPVYESTIQLVRQLKRAQIRVAVVTSSKNCTAVLRAAGLEGEFEVQVDGNVSERLALQGKPDPDIFLAAARQLGVEPRRVVVVEDALAGVEAGARGGFGLVIGVDRNDAATELLEHGAQVVVTDLAALSVDAGEADAGCSSATLPSALAKIGEFERRLARKEPIVFLDYDGTLTPIVERPELARISATMRETVRRLGQFCTVAVVSGRGLGDVMEKVGVSELIYAGSHGFNIRGPRDLKLDHERGQELLSLVEQATGQLREELSGIEGVLLEPKGVSVAVHFRLVPPEQEDEVKARIRAVAEAFPALRTSGGKKVLELHPDIDWHKGKAVLWLLEALGRDGVDLLPLYLGDDLTDENAFAALADRGLGILVRDPQERPTAASYALENVEEVREFLQQLTALLERRRR